MPVYIYEAIDVEGKLVKGSIEAENQRVVLNKLREMRYTVKNITERTTPAMHLDVLAFLDRFKGVNLQSITIFSRQFATMINAGLSMVRCLDILSQQTEDKVLQETLISVRKDVEGGATLSNALSKFPNIFSTLYVSMVKAGEMGGVLDTVLNRLSNFLEADFKLRKRVKSALTYPMLILIMAIAIVIFLVTYILPTFVQMFEGMDLPLPVPTKILILFTKAATNPAIVVPVIILLVLLGVALVQYIKTPTGRKQFDTLKLQLPVFGLLNKKVAVSRFCRTLGTLLASGVPLLQALEITGKASGNEIVAETVSKIRESIREGESIAAPMGMSGLFPPMVSHMVAVGEETGNLDQMLAKVADFYDTEVEYFLESLTSMLEPLLMLGMGAVVGFIVISVFMPMYGIITSIK